MKKIFLLSVLVVVLASCEKQRLQKQFDIETKILTENFWVDDKNSYIIFYKKYKDKYFRVPVNYYWPELNEAHIDFHPEYNNYIYFYHLSLSDNPDYTFKFGLGTQYGKIENNILILYTRTKGGLDTYNWYKSYYTKLTNQIIIDMLNKQIDEIDLSLYYY